MNDEETYYWYIECSQVAFFEQYYQRANENFAEIWYYELVEAYYAEDRNLFDYKWKHGPINMHNINGASSLFEGSFYY